MRIGRGNEPIQIELKEGDNWLGFEIRLYASPRCDATIPLG